MRFQITNWSGQTVFESEESAPALKWLRLFGQSGDALWDNDSDSDNPMREVD